MSEEGHETIICFSSHGILLLWEGWESGLGWGRVDLKEQEEEAREEFGEGGYLV